MKDLELKLGIGLVILGVILVWGVSSYISRPPSLPDDGQRVIDDHPQPEPHIAEKNSNIQEIKPPNPNPKADPSRKSASVDDQATKLGAEMSLFSNLRKKAIHTELQKQELMSLRRNRGLLNLALTQVLEPDLPTNERQEVVTYLSEALNDNQNPEREVLAAQIEQVILSENLHPNQPKNLRHELAADKGELILSYLGARPDRLQFLLKETSQSPNGKVLSNALAVIERRRAESLKIINELEKGVSN